MTIFTKTVVEFANWHIQLTQTYADESVDVFIKHVAVRAGYLGHAILAAIMGPVLIAINLIAFTFNLLSLGLVEPLDKFTRELTGYSSNIMLLIFSDIMATVDPGSQWTKGVNNPAANIVALSRLNNLDLNNLGLNFLRLQ